MKLRTLPKLTLPALLLCTAAAHADEASKLAKARQYFALTHAEQTSRQMMDTVLEQMKGELPGQLTGVTLSAEQKKVYDGMMDELRATLEQKIGFQALAPEYEKLLADLFTEDQLDQLVAFYSSPAGQALVAKTPELIQEVNGLAQARMQAALPELQAEVKRGEEQMLKAAGPAHQ